MKVNGYIDANILDNKIFVNTKTHLSLTNFNLFLLKIRRTVRYTLTLKVNFDFS